ncbi:hypothetical protein P7K49_027601 [Saguinus oedipus]|uniref:Uncharacterized protein n=1 Tax=Saguinus oedipus TaxID=9490 RepID=A0ABQ9UB82_SAGOE|nr:hypothetical protein P7K49_027601 [Saguinus oedipus]
MRRAGNALAPPGRLLCCHHVAWAGPDVKGRGGTAQAQKRGRGTRLVVLLPESRRQSCSCRSPASRLTMSHLVEPPPPLHNNNNNCEESDQSLPPPAGLNSECGAEGSVKGMGEEEPPQPPPPARRGRREEKAAHWPRPRMSG